MAFEAFLTQRQLRARPIRRRSLTVVLSLGLHGLLLVAAVVYSFWRADEVLPPAVSVTFLGGARPAPPPPQPAIPPEPPKPRVRAVRPEQPRIAALVQPRTPPNDKPPPSEEHATDSGEQSLLEGAPGGALGNTGVAALAARPPRPRAPEPAPVTLPPSIGSGQRITDINDPRFRPSLPGPLNRAGVMLWGLFRVCVGSDGNVKNVEMMKPAEPRVDGEWMRLIRTWQYRPYAIEGRPTPFCHTIRLEVRGTS